MEIFFGQLLFSSSFFHSISLPMNKTNDDTAFWTLRHVSVSMLCIAAMLPKL